MRVQVVARFLTPDDFGTTHPSRCSHRRKVLFHTHRHTREDEQVFPSSVRCFGPKPFDCTCALGTAQHAPRGPAQFLSRSGGPPTERRLRLFPFETRQYHGPRRLLLSRLPCGRAGQRCHDRFLFFIVHRFNIWLLRHVPTLHACGVGLFLCEYQWFRPWFLIHID